MILKMPRNIFYFVTYSLRAFNVLLLDAATLAREGNLFFLKQADFFVFALTEEANKRNQESDEKYVNHVFSCLYFSSSLFEWRICLPISMQLWKKCYCCCSHADICILSQVE